MCKISKNEIELLHTFIHFLGPSAKYGNQILSLIPSKEILRTINGQYVQLNCTDNETCSSYWLWSDNMASSMEILAWRKRSRRIQEPREFFNWQYHFPILCAFIGSVVGAPIEDLWAYASKGDSPVVTPSQVSLVEFIFHYLGILHLFTTFEIDFIKACKKQECSVVNRSSC